MWVLEACATLREIHSSYKVCIKIDNLHVISAIKMHSYKIPFHLELCIIMNFFYQLYQNSKSKLLFNIVAIPFTAFDSDNLQFSFFVGRYI